LHVNCVGAGELTVQMPPAVSQDGVSKPWEIAAKTHCGRCAALIQRVNVSPLQLGGEPSAEDSDRWIIYFCQLMHACYV
jgi:hypothetical protein